MSILRNTLTSPLPEFEYAIDVAVIGAGACGLTAALAARDAGADVLVFERDKRPWGSTSMSLGAVCGVGSKEQQRHGIEDTAAAFVADVMAKTAQRADRRLARLIGERSGGVLDWLNETHQVPLLLDAKWTGLGHSARRLHIPPGRSGEELLALLLNACARAGAEVVTEATVIALYANEAHRVVGLKIERPGGVIENIGCGAVVLATCGFGGNESMIAEHIPKCATRVTLVTKVIAATVFFGASRLGRRLPT